MTTHIIAHLDMDAFFAAVEERDNPWLKGLPLVVGADPLGGKGRGVVSTANYKAREYGIKSALPISRAWRYSEEARKKGQPAAAFLIPSFKKYEDASKQVFETVRKHSPIIQKTSVDEAYFDLSHTHSFKKATVVAQEIKRAIKRKTKLTCSIGISINKMVAKIASDFNKPNGLTVVLSMDIENFLAPLSVRMIPGVGPKTETVLIKKGIKTIADLKTLSWQELEKMLGSFGLDLYQKARGIGDAELSVEREVKSIGKHETFLEDTSDFTFVLDRFSELAADIIHRMKKKNFSGFRTVVATIRFFDFETKTRSITSPEPMHSQKALESKAIKLALPFFEKRENPERKPIRMIVLRIEKLV